nr:tripartite tricarboxylate transporter TctB family protein [Mammaliicoccus sp. Marseille-Q6498]
MGSIIFSFILFVIFVYFLINSLNMENLREVDPIGPSGIPSFALFFLVVLLFYTLVKEILKYKRDKQNNQEVKQTSVFNKSLLIIMCLTISITIFILLINKIGFLLSCLFLTPLLLILLGAKSKTQIIIFSIGIPVLFSFLFGNVLNIPLPRGIGFFSDISSFLY